MSERVVSTSYPDAAGYHLVQLSDSAFLVTLTPKAKASELSALTVLQYSDQLQQLAADDPGAREFVIDLERQGVAYADPTQHLRPDVGARVDWGRPARAAAVQQEPQSLAP